jgi:3-hydroxyacyl-[acyl-carrier-protein] dehydratase
VTVPVAPFGRDVIEQLIPHRPPFLLVDEILELEPGKRVVGRREIRADDWWFPGHFPQRPVMPGVLTIEAIAQCGAVAVLADEANSGKIPFFAGIDDCRFKRVVEPGDVLELECEFVRVRGPIAKGQGRASVGDDVAAEATLTVFVGSEG